MEFATPYVNGSIQRLISPISMQQIQDLSLGNFLLKIWAKFYLIPRDKAGAEIEELISELLNAQSIFKYIEEVAPVYTNYNDGSVDWDVSYLLRQIDDLLIRLDGINILKFMSNDVSGAAEVYRTQISMYRQKLCVYIHLVGLQIMIAALEESDDKLTCQTTGWTRFHIEKLLGSLASRFHEPIPSSLDNQIKEWLKPVVTQQAAPELAGSLDRSSTNGSARTPEATRGNVRRTVTSVPSVFENSVKLDQYLPGALRAPISGRPITNTVSGDEIGFEITKPGEQGGAGTAVYRFRFRHLKSNETKFTGEKISLELSEDEELDTWDALQDISSKIAQWLASPAGQQPVPFGLTVSQINFQDLTREFDELGSEIVRKNLLFQLEDDPDASGEPNSPHSPIAGTNSAPLLDEWLLNAHFRNWKVQDWIRLSKWWLLRAELEKQTTNRRPPAVLRRPVIVDQTLDQWLSENSRSSYMYLYLLKAIFILYSVLGGKGITFLLTPIWTAEIDKLQKEVKVACLQFGNDAFERFLKESNRLLKSTKQRNHASSTNITNGPLPANMALLTIDTSGLDSLVLVDKSHPREERDEFGAQDIIVEFQALGIIEFNTRPCGPVRTQSNKTYVLIQLGYTDRERNIPMVRLQNAESSVIKCAPVSEWDIIEKNEVGVNYEYVVRYIRVRDLYVGFATCSDQDGLAFNDMCQRIRSREFLKKMKSKSWSIEGATYTNNTRPRDLEAGEAEISIVDSLLPGADGSSRQRSIIVKPRYRPQAGFRVDGIPFHSVQIQSSSLEYYSNQAAIIELSWSTHGVQKDEFMFSPYNQRSNPRIYHYHHDDQDNLHQERSHNVYGRRPMGSSTEPTQQTTASIPPQHMECYMTGVVGKYRYKGSTWVCPYSMSERDQAQPIRHWLKLTLKTGSADFCRWIFEKDLDELSLERQVDSFYSPNRNNELHIFKSQLYSEYRILEIKRNGSNHNVAKGFVNPLTSLTSAKDDSLAQVYRLEGLLSHPYGSRLFDGDVGRDWATTSSPFSDYGIRKIDGFPIVRILRPSWIPLEEVGGFSNFTELTLKKFERGGSLFLGRRSSDPIFIKNNGSIIFYEDKQSRSGEDLICWTYGNNGNTFIYFTIMEFLPRYVGFKNTIQMKVRYEWNCVTVAGLGKPTDLEKTGLLTMKFADSSSEFRRYCESKMGLRNSPSEAAGSPRSSLSSSTQVSFRS